MEYKVLYRKYRPKNFDEVIGQTYTINMLKNAFINNELSHAYIFTGPRGTGKTSTAKLFAKLINCENPVDGKPCEKCPSCLNISDNPDIIEMDAASNTGVDNVREIINNVKIAPSYSKYKVYIIDEVHMLSNSAFNALLLTLEEPPKNIIFILATTEIQSVPITILSRCQRFDFNKISKDVMHEQLRKVCNLENIKIEDDAIDEIVLLSEGGMRDAYSILDQVYKNNELITVDIINKSYGSVSRKFISELINAVNSNNVDKVLKDMNSLKNSSNNFVTVMNKIIEYLYEQGKRIKLGELNENFEFYNNLMNKLINLYSIKNIPNPFLYLEMNLLESMETKNYFPGNNLTETSEEKNMEKTEEKAEIIPNKEQKTTKKPEKIEISEKSEVLPSNIDVRVNNTFVECSKKLKLELAELYNEFINNIADNNIKNLIVDSTIEVASDKYAIIAVDQASTAENLNHNIIDLEKEFNKFNNKEIKFVVLTKEDAENAKKEYSINLKNNVKYNYQEEIIDNDTSDSIFDNDVLEIV